MSITLLYAGLLGLLAAVLSFRVIWRRIELRLPFGDGGDAILATRVRVFGNLTEYLPLMLLLMALVEASGGATWGLHLLGGTFLFARICHAAGLDTADQERPWKLALRGFGVIPNWLCLLGAALWAATLALGG